MHRIPSVSLTILTLTTAVQSAVRPLVRVCANLAVHNYA